MRCPKHIIDPIAKGYWHTHADSLEQQGILTPLNALSYGVLCQVYADMRNAQDSKERNKLLDNYSKLATKFGTVPHIAAAKKMTHENIKDAIDPGLKKLIG